MKWDASIAASTVDTNIMDTNPNNVFRGNVDIKIEHYNVDQDHHWGKKDKNQIHSTLFAFLKVRPGHETNKLPRESRLILIDASVKLLKIVQFGLVVTHILYQ